MTYVQLAESGLDEDDPIFSDAFFYQVDDNFAAWTGFVMPHGGIAVPTGWLACDGASVAVATYPALWAVIGYTYGGSGANFNVPNILGRTVIGVGTGSGLTARALNDAVGVETHPLTTAENGSHTHAQVARSGGSGTIGREGASFAATEYDDINTDNSGSGTAHQNMAPFLVIDWMIKT